MFTRLKTIRCYFHFPDRWIFFDFSCECFQTIFRKKRYLIRASEGGTNTSIVSKFYTVNEKGIESLGQSIDFINQNTYWDPYTPFPCMFISWRDSDSVIRIFRSKKITKIFLWEYPRQFSCCEFKHIYFPEKDSKENIKLVRIKTNVASGNLYFSVFQENVPALLYEDNDEKIIEISSYRVFIESSIPPTNETEARCSHICLDDDDNVFVFLGSNYIRFDRYVTIPSQELFQTHKPILMNCYKLDKPKAFDRLTPNPNNLYGDYNTAFPRNLPASDGLFFFESGLVLT